MEVYFIYVMLSILHHQTCSGPAAVAVKSRGVAGWMIRMRDGVHLFPLVLQFVVTQGIACLSSSI